MSKIAASKLSSLTSIFEFIFGEHPPIPGSLFGEVLVILNTIILTILGALYFYQLIISGYSVLVKSKKYPPAKAHASYIFVTSARNEETVIAQLISSIRALNYPLDKIQIHVIADNCTDRTKIIAEEMAVTVFERNDTQKRGKSYAIEYYFSQVKYEKYPDDFAGFIVIDTDNILDTNYLQEINKVYQATKADVVAAYRASSNIGDSFWSFGTGYSFLRECGLLHKGRERLGLSSYVSGTSFFVSLEKIVRQDGWKHHLLIEDIEFSAAHVLEGNKTHYAHDAIFYDEQPNNLKDSWNQRMRWVKGLYQVYPVYAWPLFKSIFTGKKTLKQRFSAYETTLFVTPNPGFIIFWFIIYGLLAILNLIFTKDFNYFAQTYLFTIFDFMFSMYVFTTVMSLIISFSNWKRIKMSAFKKVVLPFIAYFFLLTYVPMLIIAPFVKITWKPVKHHGLKKPI